MRPVAFARPGRVLLSGLAIVIALGLGAGPALAATAWTITPGGPISASASKTTVKDTQTGASFTCTSTLSGTLKAGSSPNGTDIGSITGGSFGRCAGPLGLVFTIKLLDLPWHINFTSVSAGVLKGTISHMELSVATSGCSFVLDGTRGGASNGMVNLTWSLRSGQPKTSGGNLHVYDVNGCFGLFVNGDAASYSATYTISPKQTITSP